MAVILHKVFSVLLELLAPVQAGVQVTEGSGRMLVVAVGVQSEWGRTMALVATEAQPTPLQVLLCCCIRICPACGVQGDVMACCKFSCRGHFSAGMPSRFTVPLLLGLLCLIVRPAARPCSCRQHW